MRTIACLCALLIATAAAPPPTAVTAPGVRPSLGDLRASPPAAAVCRDHIDVVRAERGLPKLDRGNASNDEPLLIAAVDERIDGCSVMVMKNDTSDIRPLPKPSDGPVRLQPLLRQ